MVLIPPPKADGGRPRHAGAHRFAAARFLIALVLFYVVAPFLEQFRDGDLVEAMLLTLVLSMAVLVVGKRRETLPVAAILALPAIVLKWINHFRPDLVNREIFRAAGLVFVAFVVSNLLRYIIRAPRVDAEVLCASVATYLTLGILWMLAYLLVEQWTPAAFAFSGAPASNRTMEGFTALYFSLITLCTVGYGDIVPVSGPARMLAMTEALMGTLYMAVLVARLVSLYAAPDSRAAPTPAEVSLPETDLSR